MQHKCGPTGSLPVRGQAVFEALIRDPPPPPPPGCPGPGLRQFLKFLSCQINGSLCWRLWWGSDSWHWPGKGSGMPLGLHSGCGATGCEQMLQHLSSLETSLLGRREVSTLRPSSYSSPASPGAERGPARQGQGSPRLRTLFPPSQAAPRQGTEPRRRMHTGEGLCRP